MYRISLCEQLFSPSPWWGRGGQVGRVGEKCISIISLFEWPSHITKEIIHMKRFFLSGYGDKEVYNKLNPELEKRLPREYTEWRRYSQGCH